MRSARAVPPFSGDSEQTGRAACRTVFKDEGLSGATTKRPALLRCLKKLEHGATLSVGVLATPTLVLRDASRLAPGGWVGAQGDAGENEVISKVKAFSHA